MPGCSASSLSSSSASVAAPSTATSDSPPVNVRRIVGTRTVTLIRPPPRPPPTGSAGFAGSCPSCFPERLQRRRDCRRRLADQRHRVLGLEPVTGVEDHRLGLRIELSRREQL